MKSPWAIPNDPRIGADPRIGPEIPAPEPDYEVEDHGSIVLVRPLSEAAREWIDENVSDDRQEWAGAIAVEPRHVEALIAGMNDAGLTMKGAR